LRLSERYNPLCGSPTRRKRIYNSDEFPRARESFVAVDRLALVDRSTRRTATGTRWSIGQPRCSHELQKVSQFLLPFFAHTLFAPRSWFPAGWPELPVYRSSHILYLSLVEITYPLLSKDSSSLQPNVRVAFCDLSPRVFSLGTAPRQLATISSLNATNPLLYVYFVECDNGIRYARDATVRFDHLHPFILRRIAVFSEPGMKRDRVCISWNIFISYFISYTRWRWLDIYYFPFRGREISKHQKYFYCLLLTIPDSWNCILNANNNCNAKRERI